MLNARDVPLKRTALRVVADSNLQTPVDSKLLKTAEEIPTLFLAGPDVDTQRVRHFESRGVEVFVSSYAERNDRLRHFLRHLAVERELTNLLVEGGSELLGSLFDQSLVNQAEIFIAPTLIGGEQAISPVGGFGVAKVDQNSNWRIAECDRKGRDIHLSCLRIDAAATGE
jgi:diaminohydroxyphosphoribosylaminopyrimidine deaminase/5-amino-6-(5-phosphoribosylamino)uracil reductase